MPYPNVYFVRDLVGYWMRDGGQGEKFQSLKEARAAVKSKIQHYNDGFGGFKEYAIVRSQLVEIIQ